MTYTLGITPVDPILYQLPFERFLNPDRVTMPDIDVDFEDGRRDEVIAYVGRKYGQDHVAQIITFGTMLARAAIRDVGRVLGHSYGEVDRIAKAVPNQLGIKLDEALEIAPALREQVEADPAVKRIIDFARHLEGVARNASTHAAGVVISREPLTELMPLQKATNSDSLMTQYEMHAIEALGLLKFDFLGLSNLTILRQAVDLVRDEPRRRRSTSTRSRSTTRRRSSCWPRARRPASSSSSPPGMRRYIRELRPTSVYDLAAMVALYRPGPDGQHPGLHPAQARPGAGHLPAPAAGAVPGEDLRDLRLPGGHHVRGHRPGRLHRPRGGHARLRDPQEEVERSCAPRRRSSSRQAAERGVEPRRHRRRVHGLRAVRALRLQQGPRHLLRADRLPDRLPEGEPHGRLHDRGPDGVPGERGEGRRGRRRVPPDGHRGPAAGRPSQPSRVHRRGRRRSGSGCWPSRTSARARSNRSSRRATRAARSAR